MARAHLLKIGRIRRGSSFLAARTTPSENRKSGVTSSLTKRKKKTRKTRNTRIRQRHLAVVSAKQQRTFMLDRRSTPASANGSGALHIFLLHNGRLQTRLLRAGNNDPAGTPLMRFRRCESHQAEEVGDAATRSATSRFGGKMPGIIPSSNAGRKKKNGYEASL